jgi:hypothetical protein
MTLATYTMMAGLVVLWDCYTKLDRNYTTTSGYKPIDTSLSITSLLGALSIWKYPSWGVMSKSSMACRMCRLKFSPECGPSTSFKHIKASSRSPWELTKCAMAPNRARSFPDVQRSVEIWIQEREAWSCSLTCCLWKSN